VSCRNLIYLTVCLKILPTCPIRPCLLLGYLWVWEGLFHIPGNHH
jgi:hypothetical protein